MPNPENLPEKMFSAEGSLGTEWNRDNPRKSDPSTTFIGHEYFADWSGQDSSPRDQENVTLTEA